MSDNKLLACSWYCKDGLVRTSKYIRDDTASMASYANSLTRQDAVYEPNVDRLICDAETALSEALLAVKLAKSAYQKKQPKLKAVG